MATHLERFGTFSSSSAWKLMTNNKAGNGFGEKGKTYIKQVSYELELGRAITKEHNAKATNYGTFLERRAFELLGLDYRLVSQERLFHKTLKHYSGAPDLIKDNTVCDVKCPFSLEVFCDKIEALQNIETYKKEFPEDYWQLISNAILLDSNDFPVKHMEAVIYVPYLKELTEIRESANNYDGDQNKIAFLNFAGDDELPYLIEGKKYKNLNVFSFEVPNEDKIALIERIKIAETLLIKPFVPVTEIAESL